MSEATGEKVRIVCGSCSARFKAPASKAGKRGKCPKCGALFTVPEVQPVASAAGQPPGDVDWSAISGQASQSAPEEDPVLALAASSASDGGKRRGAAAVGTGALGGLTAEQRQMLAARVQEKMTRDFQRFDEEKPSGSFPAGMVGAIICALLGAALWFGIFAGTGKELRFMAIVVGLLAGGGMYLGLQRRSSTAAVAAAAIALGGIVAAKVAFVGWGEPFKVAAQPPPKVSKVEREIDDQYLRPDPDMVSASASSWVRRDYMYEHNLTPRTMGYTEWEVARHEWAMNDRQAALDADGMFAAFYRWNYYSDHLPQRQRQAEREWDAAQQSKAAEAAMAEGAATEQAQDASSDAAKDSSGGANGAAGAEEKDEEEAADEDEEEPAEVRSYDWSPQKKAAMEKLFAALERTFFAEVKEMPVDDLKLYHDEQREAERRARKIAAKQSGEEIQEMFVELGEDPVAAAAAAEEAKKYNAVDVQDIIAVPLALAGAWFLGRGWN